MARVLDWTGTLNFYNDSKNESIADRRALANDFRMIGQDIQKAIDDYAQKEKEVFPDSN